MCPLVGVGIALLGVDLRPAAGTVHAVGIDGALVYHVSVSPAVLRRTPAWADGQDPPLSPLKAILLADTKRAKLVQDSADYRWELETAALRQALGGDRWYYEITYFAHFQGAASTGHPPFLRVIVLMDGTVPDPVVWKRADWMRAMKTGAFDPRRPNAADTPKAGGPLGRATETDRIARLINQLGDSSFKTREAAARDLAAVGPSALGGLDRAAAASPDAEVRQRGEQVGRVIRARSPGRLRIAGYDYELPPWWDRVHVDVPTTLKDELEVCQHVGERYGQWQGTKETWREALKIHALAAQRRGELPVWVAHCHMAGDDYGRAAQVYRDLCERADTQGKDADWYRSYLGYNAGLAYELAGDPDRAVEWYARTAALYPRYAGRSGNRDQAIAYYARSAAQGAEGLGHFDLAETSRDPEFGTTPGKPVRVGTGGPGGPPAAARAYLRTLRDPAGRPVRSDRLGWVSESPGDPPLEVYEVTTASGGRFRLFLDLQRAAGDPVRALAPSGFRKSRM